MSNIPSHLQYTESHEWVSSEDNGNARIGITDHAQHLLGDMVFVELPELEAVISAGDECGVVESVKAASDVYSPVAGEVTEGNEALADAPEMINNDPFGDGWIFKIKPEDAGEINELMDSDAYAEMIAEDE